MLSMQRRYAMHQNINKTKARILEGFFSLARSD